MLTVIALSGAVGVSLAHLAPSQNALSARGDMPPGVTIGSDGYPDPVTLGHFFVHTAVHVRDMAAARRFYGDMLGMRHVASVETPERDFAITMMGHGQGGRNGTGFMTGPEFVLETTNLAGLIELIYSREWSVSDPWCSFHPLRFLSFHDLCTSMLVTKYFVGETSTHDSVGGNRPLASRPRRA